jgi:nucleotide-binding universal stress UspA family protein
MKKILVPCDFSKPAISAYHQALDIAAQSEGVIHLLHVIEPPLLNDTILMPTLNFEEQLMKELKENAEDQFKKIMTEEKKNKTKATYEIQYGAVPTCILEYIKENSIDLVLMGSTGASGIKEYIIGSNAERIVRLSPVPVLVVKEYYESPIRNIVFPNDLEMDDQDGLLLKIKALRNFFKAKLHIVRINTPSNFIVDTITRERLERFANHHMLTDYTINIFNHITTEEGILGFADMINADMIAMGTHSHTGLFHLTKGSVAEDIVNHSKRLIWTCTLKRESVVTN